jgi:single-strand DNA-binding protein
MGELKLVRINRVQISGRVTRDVVVRYSPDGTAVVTFTVAFNRWVKSDDGGWREIPGFIGVLTSGRLAERCGEHLKKGSPVYLEGRLQSRRYETRDGQSHNVIEIRAETVQFLERDPHPEDEQPGHETARGQQSKKPATAEEGNLFPETEKREEEE